MRNLNANEINDMVALDDRQCDPSDRWIEATVAELANANITLACSDYGNTTSPKFVLLAGKKCHARKVRGCVHKEIENGKTVDLITGLLAIKIQTEETAEKIEALTGLRFDGPADGGTLKGFMVFEDE
jgi:hypothetical protein